MRRRTFQNHNDKSNTATTSQHPSEVRFCVNRVARKKRLSRSCQADRPPHLQFY